MEGDRIIGSCEHGKAVHYGFPCAKCEAKIVTDRIADEFRAGFTWENGVWYRIHPLVEAAIEQCVERVRRYESGKK